MLLIQLHLHCTQLIFLPGSYKWLAAILGFRTVLLFFVCLFVSVFEDSSYFYLKIYLQEEGEIQERNIFHLWVQVPNGCNGQNWADLKSGARGFTHVGAGS